MHDKIFSLLWHCLLSKFQVSTFVSFCLFNLIIYNEHFAAGLVVTYELEIIYHSKDCTELGITVTMVN